MAEVEFKVPSHWIEVPKTTPALIEEFGQHAFRVGKDGKTYRADYTHADYQKWLADKIAKRNAIRAEKEQARKDRKESVDRRIDEAFKSGFRQGRIEAEKKAREELSVLKEEDRHQMRMAKIRGKTPASKGSVSAESSAAPASPTPAPAPTPVAVAPKKAK